MLNHITWIKGLAYHEYNQHHHQAASTNEKYDFLHKLRFRCNLELGWDTKIIIRVRWMILQAIHMDCLAGT